MNAPTSDTSELIPNHFPLQPDSDFEPTVNLVRMEIPEALRSFLAMAYAEHTPIVIGEFYHGEEFLIHVEDLMNSIDADGDYATDLIANGWPARFVDRLVDFARQDVAYLRVYCAA